MPLSQNSYTQTIKYLPDYFDVDDGMREVPVNLQLTAEGFLQKDYGIDDILSTFSDPVLWVKNFKKKNNSQYTIIASGTKLYIINLIKLRAYPLASAQTAITGTVSVTNNSITVTGLGTNFVTDLVTGQTIDINGELCIITNIANATSLTIDSATQLSTASGLTLKKNTDKLFTAGALFGSIEYNDELFFGNAVDDYSKFEGNVITSFPTAPKGNIFDVFEDRIFVSGVTVEPLTIYYSDVAVPSTFAVTSVLKPLGTDNVTGLVNYYGSLVILKRNTLWKMTFIYDQVAAAFLPKLELLNRNYGCCGFRAYAWVENDIWFFTGNEVRAIGFRDQQTGVLGLDPSVISNDIKETLKLLNQSAINRVVMFYNDRKVYMSVPLSTKNDIVFVSHLLYKRVWTKIKGRQKSFISSIDVRDDIVYFASSNENKVFKWNKLFKDINLPILSYVNFKEYEDKDFSQTNVFRYIDIKFKNLQSRVQFNIWVDNFDIRNQKSKTTFVGTDIEGEENSLGEVPFGENLVADAFGQTIISSNFVKRRLSLLQKGTIIQFGLYNNELNESFTIVAFEITGYRKSRRYYSHNKVISI